MFPQKLHFSECLVLLLLYAIVAIKQNCQDKMSDVDGELDIADAASTGGSTPAKARGNRGTRQPNYTPIEDELCARAIIHASEDSIHGAKQKGVHFEAEIGKAYEFL